MVEVCRFDEYRGGFEPVFWCFDGIPVFCLFWRYLKAIVWSVYRKSGLLEESKVFGSIFWNSGSGLCFDPACFIGVDG